MKPNAATMPEGTPPPPPTFVPIPDPVAQGHPAPSQPPQQQQGPPPPPGYYPAAGGAVPIPVPTVYYTQAMPGYVMRPPRVPPQPGMVVIGYETTPPDVGCCRCEDLNAAGWLTVILLCVFFLWPFAWIPCLIESFHDPSARPIYGWPGQQPGTVPQQQGYSAPTNSSTPVGPPSHWQA